MWKTERQGRSFICGKIQTELLFTVILCGPPNVAEGKKVFRYSAIKSNARIKTQEHLECPWIFMSSVK